MTQHLQREIQKLKKTILAVGTLVEDSFCDSIKALLERDSDLADRVIRDDEVIDQQEVEVEEECLKILALHQPVAIDLRFIIAVMKINNDLERIGDLASNLAARSKALAHLPAVEIPPAIPRMAAMVQSMLKDSLEALVEQDASLADRVLKTDDQVDSLHVQMFQTAENLIKSDPEHTNIYIQMLSINRYLERAADHTTNIAEDILYMLRGEIQRHIH